MNGARRKQLGQILEELEKTKSIVENIDLQSVKDEEQDAYDNMPEGLQQGEKGEQINEFINYLEEAQTGIEEALSGLATAIENVQNCEPTGPKPPKAGRKVV